MKIIFALLFYLLVSSGASVLAQAETNTGEEIGVETVSLARDNGDGKPGNIVDGFLTSDVPIHCLIDLTSSQPVTVKMNLVAVIAAGIKPGAIIVAVSYKTNGKQKSVRFNASPEGDIWVAGTYRVDVLLDGKLAKSLKFEIAKTPQQIEKEKQRKPKSAPARGKKMLRSQNG